MGTTIKLYYVDRNDTYKEWELIPSKLLVVEDIASYLAPKPALTLNNMQYQKNKLEIGINIDISQTYSQPKTSTSFKYVSIQNEGELIHYYFVKEAEWRSKSCVRFELVMDVLNTFHEGQDYDFKANTRIIREHKDRFITSGIKILSAISSTISVVGTISEGDSITLRYYDSQEEDWVNIGTGKLDLYNGDDLGITITSDEDINVVKRMIRTALEYEETIQVSKDVSNYIEVEIDNPYTINWELYRKIDPVNEGINPILVRNSDENIIEESGVLGQNWYLLYRNQNDPTESLVNPVDCYLIPENLTKVNVGSLVNGAIVPATLNSGMYYYLNIRDMNNEITLSNGVSLSPSNYNQPNMVIVKKQSNGLLNVVFVYDPVNVNNTYTRVYNDIEYITLNHFPLYYYESATQLNTQYWIDNIMDNETDYWDEDSAEVYIDNIDLLDRTDAKNIKLIKLPYCPYDFEIIADKLQIVSTQWSYVSLVQGGGTIHVLKLDDLNVKLENTINANSHNPFTKLYLGEKDPSIADSRVSIASEYESKLFHSDFYSPSYVYDSFALKIDLEKCKLSSYIDNTGTNTIKFTTTSTINSKFLFTFTSYVCDKAVQNFYNVIPVARNNEEVLYNVPYINYVRTGINYEIKAKNVQNISNAVGLGLSIGSVGVALALPSAPLKIAGIVASLVSVAQSIKTTITSAINSENAIRQKQEQYQNQATSVMGSDDVDLMSEYCGNRLRYYIYQPTEVMRNLLNDLFFYAGYSSNRMGLPNHNTRVNFDYLECEASLQCISSIPQDCLEELINCFKTGITYLHKTNRASNKWDFAQQYENWEKSLM